MSLWNTYEVDSSSPRTNNRLEGWHNKLKCVVRKAHPNVFELVEIMEQEQAITEISIAHLVTGAQAPSKEKHHRRLN